MLSRGRVPGSRAQGLWGFFRILRVFRASQSVAMPPKKRPASGLDDEEKEDDARQRASRVGYKDAVRLCEAMSPFVNQRVFTNYPPDRAIKSMDKKKLTSLWAG